MIHSSMIHRQLTTNDSLYDSTHFDYAVNLPSYISMFTTPVGTMNPLTKEYKSIMDTNMYLANRLSDSAFLIQSIYFIFSGESGVEDVLHFLESYIVEVIIDSRVYVQLPLVMILPVGNVFLPLWICDYCCSVYTDVTCPKCGANEKHIFENNVIPESSSARVIELSPNPIHLMRDQFFSVSLRSNTTSIVKKYLKFWVKLVGMRKREIQ